MQPNNKRKKTDPFILHARRKLRDSLSRETTRSNDAAMQSARDSMMRNIRTRHNETSRMHDAVIFATSRLGLAVLNSMDVNVPFVVTTTWDGKTSAQTNFKSIRVSVDPRSYDINSVESVARLIQFTKGLIYHETGHILFSVPFPDLVNLVSDGEEYFMAQHPDMTYRQLFKAWNILEDQRMECAMVRMSPIMRTYFSVIVQDFVTRGGEACTKWPWVAGRTYMSKEVLTNFRREAQDYWKGTDDTLVADTASCISRYKRANTPELMMNAVVDFVNVMNRWKNGRHTVNDEEGIDSHATAENKDITEDEWIKRITDTVDDGEAPEAPEDDAPTEENHEPADDKESEQGGKRNENADVDGRSKSNSATDGGESVDGDWDAETPEDVSSSSGFPDDGDGDKGKDNTNDRSSDEAVKSEQRGMTSDNSVGEARDNSNKKSNSKHDDGLDEYIRQEAKDFMGTVNEEMGRSLPHNNAVSVMPDEDIVRADEVYTGMLGALEPLAVQVDPAWRFQQDAGVLDPTGYHLREPGDTNYWIAYDDIGSQGFDLAVSVIIDVSYSMDHMVREVGVAALGIRKACDALTIPCTVSTFSGESHILWDAHDNIVAVYPLATGSTNPEGALEALSDQKYGKSRHLVIILTDGVWDRNNRLSTYDQPGRYFMLVGIGVHRQILESLGPDIAITTSGPLELPPLVTNALVGYLA